MKFDILVSVEDSSPFCSPFPHFPFISGCIKLNHVRIDKNRIKGCAKLELRITGTKVILWDMQLSCFRIGMDGIIIKRPSKNNDKEKPNMKPIKLPNKGNLIRRISIHLRYL